jgi:DeoR family transcriptional regulator, aga operon transcriptional repressor
MKRAMMRAAQRVLVVADSSKFGQSALVRVAGLEDVDLIVTDDGLAEAKASDYSVEIRRVSPAIVNVSPLPLPRTDDLPRTTMEPALVPAGLRPQTPESSS